MSRAQRLAGIFLAVVAGSVSFAGAQEAVFSHVHLTVTDYPTAIEWYTKHMEGEAQRGSVAYGETLVRFHLEKDAEIEGSAGSAIEHIAFSFRDLDAKMKEFEEAGVKILAPPRDLGGVLRYAFIEDPWGTKIEVMQDPDQLGFHHVHLRGPDPGEVLDWFVDNLGGERTKYKGRLDAVRYGEVWLFSRDSGGEAVAATGAHLRNEQADWRAIDHLGFTIPDIDAIEQAMKGKGIRFTLDPIPFRSVRLAGVEGPNGISIELVDYSP
jgi:catechol 2,3-dioxygenase-like lactoylglutathione lyase family enzyme